MTYNIELLPQQHPENYYRLLVLITGEPQIVVDETTGEVAVYAEE